jgi:SAM-dependent methyltransferase
LRARWSTVPVGGNVRVRSTEMLEYSDADLLKAWQAAFDRSSTGDHSYRAWYHELYVTRLEGQRVLDLGCGFGLSSLYFAINGAKLTFADVIEDNVRLMERLCKLRNVNAEFLFIESEASFSGLTGQYDYILALGSLINAPLKNMRKEIQAVLPALKPGGRWLHFAYPKTRWEQEGCIPFAEWGNHTDGPDTPWMEYHDWPEVQYLFEPYRLDLLLDLQWHHNAFNWFDLRVHPPE